MTPIGDGQGRRDSGYASAHDEGSPGDRERKGRQCLIAADLLYDGTDCVDGLAGGLLGCLLVRPRDLLPDVGDLHLIGVETGRGGRTAESRLVHGRRARGDDHPVQAVVLGHLTDQGLAWLRAYVLVVAGQGDAGAAPHRLHHPCHVDGARDVQSTVTDEYANPCHVRAPMGEPGFPGRAPGQASVLIRRTASVPRQPRRSRAPPSPVCPLGQ